MAINSIDSPVWIFTVLMLSGLFCHSTEGIGISLYDDNQPPTTTTTSSSSSSNHLHVNQPTLLQWFNNTPTTIKQKNATATIIKENVTATIKENETIEEYETIKENKTIKGAINEKIVATTTNNNRGENSNINNNLFAREKPQQQHQKRVSSIMFAYRSGNSSDYIVEECTASIADFPPFFTDTQRKNGALVMAFLIGMYCFTLIAIICDSYFLPCVERICQAFKISQDVAAAVFMSMATSAPELFTNVIGTFVTESDIGLGTIVGSSMFNTLGVAALGGLAATSPIQLDWWPLCRDCVIYLTAILLLVTMTWDGEIKWYEALILFSVYIIYFVVMFQNQRISNFCRRKCNSKTITTETTAVSKTTTTTTTAVQNGRIGISTIAGESVNPKFDDHRITINNNCKSIEQITSNKEDDTDEDDESLFKMPEGKWHQKFLFFFTWPIKIILYVTVPNPNKYSKLFPITFVMCVVWIGMTSYVVSWMVTVIGYTFSIPDSVLGLTFLAAGGCLPEAISLTIMSRKGEGSMGVSNALGANTMNILLSLGLPWFIKTMTGPDGKAAIRIESGSIEYTILALIIAAFCLFTALAVNKFRLSRKLGCVLMLIYVVFIVMAILSEMVFFKRRVCSATS